MVRAWKVSIERKVFFKMCIRDRDSFISSTFWTERIGFAAAIATIKKYKVLNVNEHMNKMGKKVQDGWTALAEKHGRCV